MDGSSSLDAANGLGGGCSFMILLSFQLFGFSFQYLLDFSSVHSPSCA